MEQEDEKEAENTEEAETTEAIEETEVSEETEEVPEKEKEATDQVAETEIKEEEIAAPAEKEEEAKPPLREKKEEEEEIVEERIYTVPLGKAWIMPPRKRAPRAMRMLKKFIIKHMKLEALPEEEGEEAEEPKELLISDEVNKKMWGRGVEKPPRKIRVRAAKDKDGNVTVYLAEGD
jgi:large subunit ribosomal protein L31e